MKTYLDTKVYILCFANVQTGGVELCHQLCSQLIQYGVKAFMLYIPLNAEHNVANPVHDFYRKYHLPYAFELEDDERNIFVVPEYFSEHLYRVQRIQRVFWWMSVDNYIKRIAQLIGGRMSNPLSEPMPRLFYFGKDDSDLTHFVQSEYARQFIKLNGVSDDKIHWVEDYLSQAFRTAQIDLCRKENIVAFNPRKGFEVTRQLMELAPDIDWRPIKDMTPAQVQELLARAKVYIDFGDHPGKDRIPREAAISGCVVITGKRGAASNDVDINIPAEFKLATTPQAVIVKIREVFDAFDTAHAKQADYRARILDDKNRFAREVAEAFEIKSLPPLSVAFVQGVGEESYLLAEELYKSKELKPCFIVDDVLATSEINDKLLLREQNRNYLRVGAQRIELITQDDARFLYREGRIKKFALLEPTDAELAELKTFYEANDTDVLIFRR